jgi:hypothetical protein
MMPAIEQTALFEINRLIEMWESMAKSARQMADDNDGRTYTLGYGYGTADALENAAKQLKSLTSSLVKYG